MPARRAPRKSTDNFTAAEKKLLWEREQGICQYCHRKIKDGEKVEYHHVLPIASGGTAHDLSNGSVLHRKCHVSFYELLHPGLARIRAIVSGRGMDWWKYRRFQSSIHPYILHTTCKDFPILCSSQQAARNIFSPAVVRVAGCEDHKLTVRHRPEDGWCVFSHGEGNEEFCLNDSDHEKLEIPELLIEWARKIHGSSVT